MSEKLAPERTALLFFDTLNGHLKDASRQLHERYRPVVPNMQKLLAAARDRGVLVCYGAANHRADSRTSKAILTDTDPRLRPWGPDGPSAKPPVTAGSWGAQVIDELAPRDADYIVPKYRWSAFHATYLDLALRTRRIDTLIISGGSTDVGVAATAYAGRDLDYNVVIPSDACTFNEPDNHEQFMKRLFPRMARVRTTAQIVEMLRSG